MILDEDRFLSQLALRLITRRDEMILYCPVGKHVLTSKMMMMIIIIIIIIIIITIAALPLKARVDRVFFHLDLIENQTDKQNHG